jgi:hypothetical protein
MGIGIQQSGYFLLVLWVKNCIFTLAVLINHSFLCTVLDLFEFPSESNNN